MNKLQILSLCLTMSLRSWAAADDVDSRSAKVTDRSDTVSQVSALTVTNVDVRFGYDNPDDRGRIVVATEYIEYAIPLRAISTIVQSSGSAWRVEYQAADGPVTLTGTLAPLAMLSGNSDFGTFSLPLARLKRLDFQQPGTVPRPARRISVFDQDGILAPLPSRPLSLSLTGRNLNALNCAGTRCWLKTLMTPRSWHGPSFELVSTNYTDFHLLHGEMLQTIPFENVKSAEFYSGEEVNITAHSGTAARMKLPRRDERTVEGFTGNGPKGDFYVLLKNVRLITFEK